MALLNRMNNSLFGNMPRPAQNMNFNTPRVPMSTQGGMQNMGGGGGLGGGMLGGLLNRNSGGFGGGTTPTPTPTPTPMPLPTPAPGQAPAPTPTPPAGGMAAPQMIAGSGQSPMAWINQMLSGLQRPQAPTPSPGQAGGLGGGMGSLPPQALQMLMQSNPQLFEMLRLRGAI